MNIMYMMVEIILVTNYVVPESQLPSPPASQPQFLSNLHT